MPFKGYSTHTVATVNASYLAHAPLTAHIEYDYISGKSRPLTNADEREQLKGGKDFKSSEDAGRGLA
jgi:hypothetical protein